MIYESALASSDSNYMHMFRSSYSHLDVKGDLSDWAFSVDCKLKSLLFVASSFISLKLRVFLITLYLLHPTVNLLSFQIIIDFRVLNLRLLLIFCCIGCCVIIAGLNFRIQKSISILCYLVMAFTAYHNPCLLQI